MSEFQALNGKYVELTGQDLFLYATQPDPNGPTKYVFQDEVITNKTAAIQYMNGKLAEAKAQHAIAGVPHDYIPGDVFRPMHTDPMCVECGQPKKSPQHA